MTESTDIFEDNIPSTIEHYYPNFHPYERFLIYEGKLDITYKNGFSETVEDAKIEFTYLPYPRIELSFITYNPPTILNPTEIIVKHPLHNKNLKFKRLSLKSDLVSNKTLITTQLVFQDNGKNKDNITINKVKFYLVNFRWIYGTNLIDDINGQIYSGRCILKVDNIQIIIDAVQNIRDVQKFLNNNTSYAITHICQLEKKGQQDFTVSEIRDILEKLYYYLSFINGSWITPILITGFDKNNQFIWDSWASASFRLERNIGIKRWFPKGCNKDFENLFPKFWHKYNDSQWNDVLKKALDWYIEINKSSIAMEGRIVLQQAALEMLANFILVELTSEIDKETYKKKDAKWAIRKLLEYYNNLLLKIPDHLSNLKKIEQSSTYNNLNDSPAIFVQIRKSIVHDTFDNQGTVETILNKLNLSKGDVIRETYTLGQWLLEIILLKIFDYQGNYVDRTNPQSNRSDGESFTF